MAAFEADRAADFGAAFEADRAADSGAAFEADRAADSGAAFEAFRALAFTAGLLADDALAFAGDFAVRGLAPACALFAFERGFAADCFAPVPGPRRDWPLPAVVRALAPLARVVPVDWRELLLFDPFDAAAGFVDFDAFDWADRAPLPFEEDERPVDVLRRRVVVCAMSV